MKRKEQRTGSFLWLAAAAFLLLTAVSCAADEHTDAYLEAENRTYASFDPAVDLGITFTDLILPSCEERETKSEAECESKEEPNRPETEISYPIRVYERMDLYAAVGDAQAVHSLNPGALAVLTPLPDSEWTKVASDDGTVLGYAKDGFQHAIDRDCRMYAELPVEYGYAKTNEETWVQAFSHLVDIRKYFRTVETLDTDFTVYDLENCDIVISMKLSTSETTIGEPFYSRNLCLLQYDILPMLQKAVELFKKDGYTVIIYDAYRPTSVQQRWFDVVRVHKWVADPSIGMGGVHDRGTAIDMSLIDREGNLLEMPTPMHTFTEESARSSPLMTETARANMDYMKNIMVQCGFTYINSEWWHFQDANTKYYLPTDHPIDSIPLLVSEQG